MEEIVTEWADDIRRDERNSTLKAFFCIILIFILIVAISFFIKINLIISIILAAFLAIMLIAISRLSRPPCSVLVAASLYKLGHELKGHPKVDSESYRKRAKRYIEDCNLLISLMSGHVKGYAFRGDIQDFWTKFMDVINRLNGYYAEPKDSVDTAKLSDDITKLAKLIHEKNRYLTKEHQQLLDKVYNDLKEVEPRSLGLRITKPSWQSILNLWNGLPRILRIVIVLLFVFALTSSALYKVVVYLGFPDSLAITVAPTVGAVITSGVLMKIECFIKG